MVKIEYKIGDCLQLMKELPDNSIDLVICDGPYYKKARAKWDHQWKTINEYLDWYRLRIEEIARITKPNSSVYLFGMDKPILLLSNIMNDYFEWKQTISWIRGGMRGGHNNYNARFETIIYYAKGNPIWNEPLMDLGNENRRMTKASWERMQYGFNKRINDIRPVNIGNVFYFPFISVQGKEKTDFPYAIQKPFKLIETLILASSNKGDTILDPFLGTGTTLRVCRFTDRNGLGFELNPECESIIEKRIMKAIPQIDDVIWDIELTKAMGETH